MRFRTFRSYVDAERDDSGGWVITDSRGAYRAGDNAFRAIFEPVPNDDLDDYGSREYREHAIRAVVAAQWAVACACEDGDPGYAEVDSDGDYIINTSAAYLARALARLPCAVDVVDGG